MGWISEGFRGSDSGVGLLAQSVDIGAGGILESAFWGVTSSVAPEAEVPDKCRYVSFLHSLDPKQKWHENNQRFRKITMFNYSLP